MPLTQQSTLVSRIPNPTHSVWFKFTFIRRQDFFCNKSHTPHPISLSLSLSLSHTHTHTHTPPPPPPNGISSSNCTVTAVSTQRSEVFLQGYKWKDLASSLAFFILMDEFTATSREESPALKGKHACIMLPSGSLFSQLGWGFLS